MSVTTTTDSTPTVSVLGLQVADLTQQQLVQRVTQLAIRSTAQPVPVFALHIGGLLTSADSDYQRAMALADLTYADGISAVALARLAGASNIQRFPTTDLGWALFKEMRGFYGRPPFIAAIGGYQGLANKALDVIEGTGLGTKVYATHGYHDDWTDVLDNVRQARPDILLLGLGAPREMLWVMKYLDHLPPTLVMTCGGWFGYIVGDESRAPKLMQRVGLEWAYRWGLQPKRLGGRYVRGFLRFPGLAFQVVSNRVSAAVTASPYGRWIRNRKARGH